MEKVKHKFLLVVYFLMSVRTKLVSMASRDKFHNAGRRVLLRNLNHQQANLLGSNSKDNINDENGNELEDTVLINQIYHRSKL